MTCNLRPETIEVSLCIFAESLQKLPFTKNTKIVPIAHADQVFANAIR